MLDALKEAMAHPYVAGFRNYASEGLMLAGGLDPVKATGSSSAWWSGFNMLFAREAGDMAPMPVRRFMSPGKLGRLGGSVAGAGFGLWNVIDSYQEEGIGGAYDAVVWETAAAAGAARFAYGTMGSSGPSAGHGMLGRLVGAGTRTAGKRIVLGGGGGMVAGMARYAGAGIGASIGQGLLGTPGAFIGGYIGAAPLRFAATNRLIAGGLAAVGITAAAGAVIAKGGATVLRAGQQHRRNQRGIDTSGSMAAFMTQNAHTMRARAVQAMHKSHLNARSALGQEANFMHMPGKNYHSRYR